MLQQTRVETVTPYFLRFMEKFPTPATLAEAPQDEVLTAWSGLGYYRRARLLQAGAIEAVKRGGVPTTRDELLSLPGVGRYTAGAIASIAFGEAVALVDGNVARVLARLFAIDEDMKGKGMRTAWGIAERLVPSAEDAGDFNQALMELGAMICTPRAPRCADCPVSTSCRARREGRASSLPVLSKKAPPRAVEMQALVATTRDGHVALARRRSEGLFGGLWEPPLIEGSVVAPLSGRLVTKRASEVTHVLSHRRLTIGVHATTLTRRALSALASRLPSAYETVELFPANEIRTRVGLSALARKILVSAGSQDQGDS